MSEPMTGHTPPPQPGGDIRIVYRASEVIALGNRRYDEGYAAGLAEARASLLARVRATIAEVRDDPALDGVMGLSWEAIEQVLVKGQRR